MPSDLDMYVVLHQRKLTDLIDAVRSRELYLHDAHSAAIEGVTTLEGVRMRRVGKSVSEVRSYEAKLGQPQLSRR